MKEISPIMQSWVGPNLPNEHIHNDFSGLVKQPIKRHLAHTYSRFLQNQGCEFIGITGSAGKTTTKEMLASVLSQKFRTRWTRENIDPVYNIPNTILTTTPGTEKMILEMGIEYPGEMDFYLWLAQPSIGICTSIYWTHTQFFGDIQGVTKEKSRLIRSLPKQGYAILNYDDKNVARMADITKAKVLTYSAKGSKKADIRATGINFSSDFRTQFTLQSSSHEIEVSLPILGQQFVSLALASAAVGEISGLSHSQISDGLENFTPPPHRMVPIKLEDDVLVIDDTYNANPLAVKEALRLVSDLSSSGRKILVLGEMKELGEYEQEGHEEVGKFAAECGFDFIIGLGDALSYTFTTARNGGISGTHLINTADREEVVNTINQIKRPGDIVLIKGSRSMKMEEVVERIYEGKS